MQQYIRDKYERKLFMAPDALGMAASPRAIAPTSNYSIERYPQQMKSLKEMGFIDVSANAAAINASKGNLQEAVEALLAGKFKKVGIDLGKKEESPKATSPAEDLFSVFGGSGEQQKPSQKSSMSILDLDFPPPPTQAAVEPLQEEISDEFEDFEIASPKSVSETKSPEPVIALPEAEDNPAPVKEKSSSPIMNNPWASATSEKSGNAFDEIDPFKGFSNN